MDNLAHTLIGAALGRAVAPRELPAAGWIGAIAGNAPDWSEILLSPGSWTPRSGVDYLVQHRGITHSFLGAAVEIVVLTVLAGAMLRVWARRRALTPPPWRWVAACVAVAVVSHLYLDWQGSYGLRPFLPWSERWYYADWVAIVDPLFWVVPLVALAWGARRHWAPALVYLLTLVGVVTVVLWLGRNVVAWWVPPVILGCAGAGVVGWHRHWFGVTGRRRAAAWGLLVLAGYAAANAGASGRAQAVARASATRRFGPDARWAALTVVGRPFHWDILLASRDSVAGPGWAAPRRLEHPAVRTALKTSQGRAIAGFARFLMAAVDSSGGRVRVSLWDARFHTAGPGPAARGWAAVQVLVR
jgi:inner membrane protein